MAYQKTIWNTGDIITAEKLNNIENGIENNQNIFNITITQDDNDDSWSDKTASEIKEAADQGLKILTNNSADYHYHGMDSIGRVKFYNIDLDNTNNTVILAFILIDENKFALSNWIYLKN